MENIFTSVIILFLILFAILTLSNDALEANIQFSETLEDVQDLSNKQNAAHIRANTVSFTSIGASVMVENTGNIPLYRYEDWDVIVEYYDASPSTNYHVDWLPYGVGGWQIDHIYLDYVHGITEVFQPTLFNQSEQLKMDISLVDSVGYGQGLLVRIVNEYGSQTEIMGRRNIPPTINPINNILVPAGLSAIVDNNILFASDADGSAENITYMVTTPPTQGILSPANTFSQYDINIGSVTYLHTGTTNDSFSIVVTDGTDTIGPFLVTIILN